MPSFLESLAPPWYLIFLLLSLEGTQMLLFFCRPFLKRLFLFFFYLKKCKVQHPPRILNLTFLFSKIKVLISKYPISFPNGIGLTRTSETQRTILHFDILH